MLKSYSGSFQPPTSNDLGWCAEPLGDQIRTGTAYWAWPDQRRIACKQVGPPSPQALEETILPLVRTLRQQ